MQMVKQRKIYTLHLPLSTIINFLFFICDFLSHTVINYARFESLQHDYYKIHEYSLTWLVSHLIYTIK